MADVYKIFGFENDKDELNRLLENVLKNGNVMEVKSGKYVRWIVGQGVEVVVAINSSNEPVSMIPYFFGNARYDTQVTKSYKEMGMNQLTGKIMCWTMPKRDMTEEEKYYQDVKEGRFPVVMSLPEFAIYNFAVLPIEASIQISAYAFEMDVFSDRAEYMAFQKGKNKFEVKSFVPIGLFAEDGMYRENPEPTAVISGEVVEAIKLTNEFSGKDFGWLRLATVGGEIDVIFDVEEQKSFPQKGQIVGGMFLMNGRIVDQAGVNAD